MANRDFKTIQALSTGLKIICGSFAPQGASAPSGVKGIGFSVARTSQGLFTITLQDKYVDLQSADCQVQLAAADDRFAQVGAADVSSAKTVEIRVIDATGAVQDISADPANRVHFCLYLKNSTVV
jgi:hypothetical protein